MEGSITITTLVYAFFGGLLPVLIWLYFLLKEDAKHPEPKTLIVITFIAGMLAVPLVLPFAEYAKLNLVGTLSVITAWALIEETLKYAMAASLVLWRRAVDETPDYVIYMVTVALGFAAAENMLFLINPLLEGDLTETFLTGNMRFIGSTLLHVIASAAVGFALAFSARSRPGIRIGAAALGLIIAVALHTGFNMFIINQGAHFAFFLVWIVAIIFFAMFGVLKYFQYKNS